jgi:hypothetical protein
MQPADAPPDASPAVPAPPSMLGQTPHEPAVRPWELELLISGAVVFALLQVPGALDRWFDRVDPALAGTTEDLFFLLYYYLKLILYTLIGSFVLHLVVRAYWVGLIGLETVFPRGIRWEEIDQGPIAREVYRERTPPIQRLIDGADRFASVIFSSAFTIVFLFLYSIAVAAAVVGLSTAISHLFLGGKSAGWIFQITFFAFAATLSAVTLVDKRMGARLEPASRTRRVLRGAMVATYWLSAGWAMAPVFNTFLSNLKKRRMYAGFWAALLVIFGTFLVVDVLARRNLMEAGSYRFLPDEPGGAGVDYAYYESLRPAGRVFPTTPSIQSDMVRDPYMRLFVPYSPERHNPALAARCPELAPLSREGMRMSLGGGPAPSDPAVRAVLACWAEVQRVTLNGRPLQADWRFYTHPRSGLRGIVAYVPTAGLPRGANLLVVDRAPPGESVRERRQRPRPPHHIPFWL